MSLEAPQMLWALGLLPLALAGYLFAQRRRRRYAVRFTNLDLLAGVVTALPRWRRHIPPAVLSLALIALIVALARPHVTKLVPRDEAAIVLALDRSGSMRADDVKPSRLEAARREAEEFVAGLPDRLRVGVISFSSAAEVLTGPLSDRTAVLQALRSLRADGGTAMGDGLARAMEVAVGFRGQSDERGDGEPTVAIILLSDGFNTTGSVDPLEAARQAGAEKIPVFTIALGTDEGLVEIPDVLGGSRFLRVPPDHETLRAMATASGGRFFGAPAEADLDAVYESLGSRIGFTPERREVTAWAAGVALALGTVAAALSAAWFGKVP